MNSKENFQNNLNFTNGNDPFKIKHRKRTSKKQLEVLEKTFEGCIRPDAKLRKKLGEQLGMTPRAVQIWFQNRRAKVKKVKGSPVKKKEKTVDVDYNTVEVFDTMDMYRKYKEGDIPFEKQTVYTNNYDSTSPFETYQRDGFCGYTPYNPEDKFEGHKLYNYEGGASYETNPYQPNPPYETTPYQPNTPYETTPYQPNPPYETNPYELYPSTPLNYNEYYESNDFHKHHDEYYHDIYINNNGCYKGSFEGSNAGYPPQYVDKEYYKDYYYKQHFARQDEQDKE